MKISVKKSFLFLIFFMSTFIGCISIAFGAPSIKPDNFSYTAEDIIEGEDLIHEFKISNVGDKALIIEKIDAG